MVHAAGRDHRPRRQSAARRRTRIRDIADGDTKPLLAGKSKEELPAIRKATLEGLQIRRRQISDWATGQKEMLWRGLRALDMHLAERDIGTSNLFSRASNGRQSATNLSRDFDLLGHR